MPCKLTCSIDNWSILNSKVSYSTRTIIIYFSCTEISKLPTYSGNLLPISPHNSILKEIANTKNICFFFQKIATKYIQTIMISHTIGQRYYSSFFRETHGP